MRRRLILGCGAAVAAVAIALALLAGGGSDVRRPGPAVPAVPLGAGAAGRGEVLVGASVNRVFNDLAYSPPQQTVLLRALAATGARVARSDTLWEATEPARGKFNWGFDDGIAGALAAVGLRWLPVIDYAPRWAQAEPGGLHAPPADPADYAAFGAAFAHRYGPGGSFWAAHPALRPLPVTEYEIWNEPDIPLFWSPAPDAGAYARLYADARAAIHAVDPTAVVLIGGLANPVAFLPVLLAADPALRSGLDGVAIHPYAATTAAVLAFVSQARAVLRGLGLGAAPLYLTEFGWATSPSSAPHYLPPAVRPGVVRATVAALGHTNCGVAGEIMYTWVTPRRNPGDFEDWYGLEAPGGGPSADADAFAQGTRQARAPGPRQPVCG